MHRTRLEETINELGDIARDTGSAEAARLQGDLLDHYLSKYDRLGQRERAAFDHATLQRLTYLARRCRVPGRIKTGWHARMQAAAGVRRLHFGQLRAANTFQSAVTVNSIPEVAGMTIRDVARMLADGEIARDYLTVQVFWHEATNVWVAINNRGLAAHCVAATRPLRLIPCAPSQAEINRLTEIEDLPTAPAHMRLQSDEERFDAMRATLEGGADMRLPAAANTMLPATTALAGRQLPSPLLPLTPGPEDRRVIAVVRTTMP